LIFLGQISRLRAFYDAIKIQTDVTSGEIVDIVRAGRERG